MIYYNYETTEINRKNLLRVQVFLVSIFMCNSWETANITEYFLSYQLNQS